jgi:large subunit ribosomal protein L27e
VIPAISYTLDVELKQVVAPEQISDPAQRKKVKKAVKTVFQERYNSGKNKWFFTKLRF